MLKCIHSESDLNCFISSVDFSLSIYPLKISICLLELIRYTFIFNETDRVFKPSVFPLKLDDIILSDISNFQIR